MKQYLPTLSLILLMLASACSTVIEGRSQSISIDTFPVGAKCLVKDNDTILARVQTPATTTIEKSKNDILVECSKEGYITNAKRNKSDVAITSAGNMVFGQFSAIGNMVDSVSGASHKYDSHVFVALQPLPPVARMDEPLTTPTVQASSSDTFMAVPVTQVTSSESTAQVASNDSAAQQAQLPGSLADALRSRNYTVTHQPLDQVIRSLMSQPAAAQEETQEVASLTATPIQHNAE